MQYLPSKRRYQYLQSFTSLKRANIEQKFRGFFNVFLFSTYSLISMMVVSFICLCILWRIPVSCVCNYELFQVLIWFLLLNTFGFASERIERFIEAQAFLAPHPPPPPLFPSVSWTDETQRKNEKEGQFADGEGEGVGVEPNYETARKLVPLLVN